MPPPRDLSQADWFWNKVDRTGECWIWNGALGAHGYGRVIMEQVAYPAHKIAWFLVMGTWPGQNLYRIGPCKDGVSGHVKGDDPLLKRCVNPRHWRAGSDNPTERTRWNARSENGFPPEFRKASKDFMPTAKAEADMKPVLLYRGNLTLGRAQALFNWTLLAQAEEAQRLGDVVKMSQAWPDAAHAVGLHRPITATQTIHSYWSRLIDNPNVTQAYPGMRAYIRTVMDDSRQRPYKLERISEQSQWATRSWRAMEYACRVCPGRWKAGEHVSHRNSEIHQSFVKAKEGEGRFPVHCRQVWPFIEQKPDTDHDLVLAVDAVVSKGLPEVIRQDVCQDLILAVLEGEVAMDDLHANANHYIKQVFRQYPTKYGPLSLDQPAPWQSSDDERTLGDFLVGAGWNTETNGWDEAAA